MLKTIACFKWVIDEADIKVDAATRKLILDRVGYKINSYDRNAIEEAVRLQEQHGGAVAALTLTQPTAKACLKDILDSRLYRPCSAPDRHASRCGHKDGNRV
jgi:electron transfer flavoprotein beta subunit